jgi:HNH endonuclease
MAFSEVALNQIYDRTSGRCHICHKKLAFTNYGKVGASAAWEVEHSIPQARGGTDHLNNLYPACISCNRSKGSSSTVSARSKHGKSRAPLSVEKRKKARTGNTLAGGALGAMVGSVGGPVGAFIGACLGASLGHSQDPDK